MKIIMVMLASADGKTTKGDQANIYTWSSVEDQKYFFNLIKKHNLIVMGSSTYKAAGGKIKLEPNKLRIVLTRQPKKYLAKTVKGQLEFTNENPKQLVKRLADLGYKTILLVGGSRINGLFLENDLVDEFYLTVEPVIFGFGNSIVSQPSLNTQLHLLTTEKLNKKGTLLLKYKVIRRS